MCDCACENGTSGKDTGYAVIVPFASAEFWAYYHIFVLFMQQSVEMLWPPIFRYRKLYTKYILPTYGWFPHTQSYVSDCACENGTSGKNTGYAVLVLLTIAEFCAYYHIFVLFMQQSAETQWPPIFRHLGNSEIENKSNEIFCISCPFKVHAPIMGPWVL